MFEPYVSKSSLAKRIAIYVHMLGLMMQHGLTANFKCECPGTRGDRSIWKNKAGGRLPTLWIWFANQILVPNSLEVSIAHCQRNWKIILLDISIEFLKTWKHKQRQRRPISLWLIGCLLCNRTDHSALLNVRKKQNQALGTSTTTFLFSALSEEWKII